MPTYDYKIEQLEKDAARWRWLTNDCDGDAQDDFTRWLAGTVASKADIDAKIDEAMAAPNVKVTGLAPGKDNK